MAIFEKAKEIVEKHPYATAGGVFLVGVVIIYFYYSSSGSSSSSTASNTDAAALASEYQANAALAASQLQEQGQLQLASIQAGVQNNATNASLTLGEENLAEQLAAIQSNNATTMAVTNTQTSAQLQGLVNSNEVAQNEALDTINANEQVQLAQVNEKQYESNVNATSQNFLVSQLTGLAAAKG